MGDAMIHVIALLLVSALILLMVMALRRSQHRRDPKSVIQEYLDQMLYYGRRRTHHKSDYVSTCRKACEYVRTLSPDQRNQDPELRAACESIEDIWRIVYIDNR